VGVLQEADACEFSRCRPIVAGAAMSLNSVSVIGNISRLRKVRL
jgi:cation transport ATPase